MLMHVGTGSLIQLNVTRMGGEMWDLAGRFIPHDGKGMPVKPDTVVIVKMRGQAEPQPPGPAKRYYHAVAECSSWFWDEEFPDEDIVSYCIVPKRYEG